MKLDMSTFVKLINKQQLESWLKDHSWKPVFTNAICTTYSNYNNTRDLTVPHNFHPRENVSQRNLKKLCRTYKLTLEELQKEVLTY